MSFYHWFSSHPNEISLSGDSGRMSTIGKELRIAGANMENVTRQSDFRRISSVPDIWSQHRLFEMLLLNKVEDASYQEYVDIANREWRAMIAILVMAESYGVKIETETVRFPGKDDPRKNYSGSGYLFAAYSTRPHRAQWPSMDIYYVKDGDTRYPIAMSSPTVHVIPTKDAWDNLRAVYGGKIPWVTDNRVFAPVLDEDGIAKPFLLGENQEDQLPAMMPVHALMLQRWLARYRAEIAQRQRNNDQAESLQSVKLLSDYENALASAFRLNAQSMPKLDSFFATGNQQAGLRLGSLRVPQDLKIFLDRALYSVIDQESTQAELLDTHRFAGGIAPECLVSKGHKDGGFTHFFVPMPVTESFWQLWRDNEDLKPTYTIRCMFSPDGVYLQKITASVIIGGITFSKTYSTGSIASESWRNLCTAGIWPRQKIANWSEYYLFCNEIGGYKLTPGDKSSIVRETPYGKHDGVDGPLTYYLLSKAPDYCAMRKDNSLIGYLKIRARDEIEAGDSDKTLRASIDFGTSATTLYAGVNEAKPKKITGMYLWSLPLINTINNDGVENSRLEKFFFPPLPASLKGADSASKRKKQAEVSYQTLLENTALAADYPSCIPMQSILADAKDHNAPRDVLSDSWIYFRSFASYRDAELWPIFCSNLKWMRAGQIDQHRIRAMLTELLMMLALEARCQRCGKISITASYPLSFLDTTRDSYYQTLNTILGSLGVSTGIEIKPPAQTGGKITGSEQKNAPLVASITESEAVFRFSVNQDSYNQNYFIVDIGGGSTDLFISLVDESFHRNSMAASLGFGARKSLIEALCSGDHFYLRELMRSCTAGLDRVIRDQNRYLSNLSKNNQDSLIEDLFSIRVPRDTTNHASNLLPENFGEAFLSTCAMSPVNAVPESIKMKGIANFVSLKKRIAFYLGAVIWLSGLMLAGKNNQGMRVSLLFAGNGSKMVRWLAPDMQRTRHFIHLLFQQASQMNLTAPQLDCRFSAMPKEEVAMGSLLEVQNSYFALDSTTAKQVQFGQAHEEGDFPAYRAMQYEQEPIQTNDATIARYLGVFKVIAQQSYGWSFEEGEYDVSILDDASVCGQIDRQIQQQGYFLSAVEVISGKYLQDFDTLLTEKGADK